LTKLQQIVAGELGSSSEVVTLLLHVAALGVFGLCLGLFFRVPALLLASFVVATTVGGCSIFDGQTFVVLAMRVIGSLAILQIAYAGGLLLSSLRAKNR
jgi:hypothetical protein